jgi:hypothetical protein
MLYLRNTNQQQTLDRGIQRGPAATPLSSSVSASYTTNTSSLFVLLNDGATRLSTTSSATTNFLAAPNSVVSASIAGTAISSSNSVTLFVSASDGSLLYNQTTTGSALNTNFTVGSNVRYTISSSVSFTSPITGTFFDGLGRQVYDSYYNPLTTPNWPDVATPIGSIFVDSGSLEAVFGTGVQSRMNQWLGYFRPSTNETYTFILNNDDQAILWLGNNATASVLIAGSALVQSDLTPTGSVQGSGGNSGSVALTAGVNYPIRIQYADGAGDRYFTASFSTPTITRTIDFTNYTFCSTSSLGF